ncbi:MAG: hypothetical protein AB9860_02030 [Methanomassiliicoccales archaeon]
MDRMEKVEEDDLIPWYVTGAVAILCAAVLIAMAALGPSGTGDIEYRTSQSGIWQVMGQDLADLFLIAPLLLIGGALQLMRKSVSKYFLVLTPLTLMYTGFSLGIGQEWTLYDGNVETYYWMFLALIIGGLLLLMGVLPKFGPGEGTGFQRKKLIIFVLVMGLVMLMFAGMWVGQINEVIATGDLSDGSYTDSPNVFWTIRFLDLGICVPLGFVSLFLLLRRPEKGYPLVLLFFGFFLTMAVTVNAMALVMVMNDDPAIEAMGAGLYIFPVMAVLFLVGLLYLLKHRGTAVKENNLAA